MVYCGLSPLFVIRGHSAQLKNVSRKLREPSEFTTYDHKEQKRNKQNKSKWNDHSQTPSRKKNVQARICELEKAFSHFLQQPGVCGVLPANSTTTGSICPKSSRRSASNHHCPETPPTRQCQSSQNNGHNSVS